MLFGCAILCSTAGRPALAIELRVETRMYAGDDPEVIAESTTLFHDGVVYDFRGAEGRVTIYRAGQGAAPGRFLLLDKTRLVRTEIDTHKLSALMDKLQRWGAAQDDPFLRFVAEPKFQESFEEDAGLLLLTSDHLSYRITTQPAPSPEAAREVKDFLDQFAKLHTLLEAGLPPHPRLMVNEALLRHSAVALDVQLSDHRDGAPSLRAEHIVNWLLSKQDMSRIDGALNEMAAYREVTNIEFQQARLAERR